MYEVTNPKQAERAGADFISGTFHHVLQPGFSRPEEDLYQASQSLGTACMAEASEHKVRDIATDDKFISFPSLYLPFGGLTYGRSYKPRSVPFDLSHSYIVLPAALRSTNGSRSLLVVL